jgi:hypothetical protein
MIARVFDRYLSIHASLPPRVGRRRPSEQLAERTPQCATQFVQNIGSIHPGSVVVQPEQRGIGHTRFLSQAVQGPLLLRKDLSKPASNHASRVA